MKIIWVSLVGALFIGIFSFVLGAGQDVLEVNGSGLIPTDAPVITKEIDADIAAIGDALRNLAEIEDGVELNKDNAPADKDAVSEAGSIKSEMDNNFKGFKIRSITEIKNYLTNKDQVSIATPSGGVIEIINSRLVSIKDTNYDALRQDLETAKISVIEKKMEEGIVRIKLRITKENSEAL